MLHQYVPTVDTVVDFVAYGCLPNPEQKVITRHSFVSADLGGILGICLGASFLTIAEFIQFGVASLVYYLSRKKTTPTEITEVKPFS